LLPLLVRGSAVALLLPLLVRGSVESVLLPLLVRGSAESVLLPLVRGSAESVLLPLVLVVRGLMRLLACRRYRNSRRRWCRYNRAGYTPSAEGLERRKCRSSHRRCCRYTRAACRPLSEGLPGAQGGRAGGATPRQARWYGDDADDSCLPPLRRK